MGFNPTAEGSTAFSACHFAASTVETDGASRVIRVDAFLGDFSPGDVRVELSANGTDGGEPVRQDLTQRAKPGSE